MMKRFGAALAVVMTPTLLVQADKYKAAPLAYVGFDRERGTSNAVIVEAFPLAHTEQILPLDADGRLIGKKDAATQIKRVFERLADTLAASRSGLDRLVKLNLVVVRNDVVAEVERFLARQFVSGRGPAVSFVVSPLPIVGALVGVDAVAVASQGEVRPRPECRVLPAGARIYVAGQAEPAKSLAEATRKTLEGLRATLKFLELSPRDVIQVKSFLTPMSSVADVNTEMAQFFGRDTVPPQVFVEWQSSLPIEIELIVQAGKDRPGPVLEFLTPPGLKASPVFSRVTRINRGKSIYISGLRGRRSTGPREEIIEIFDRLGGILKKSGSDFRHLAKATYYVTSAEATRKMGELRPRYYDPRRPPSASLAQVAAVGLVGKSVTLDMIAVPAE